MSGGASGAGASGGKGGGASAPFDPNLYQNLQDGFGSGGTVQPAVQPVVSGSGPADKFQPIIPDESGGRMVESPASGQTTATPNMFQQASQGIYDAMDGARELMNYQPMNVTSGYQPSTVTGFGYDAAQIDPSLYNNVGADSIGFERITSPEMQAAQTTQADIDRFLNPYTTEVVDQSMADIERNRLMQANQAAAQAQAAGAFGGSRGALMEAEIARNALDQSARTAGDLRRQGFTTAAQLAQQDVARRQQAGTLNAQQALQAALANQRSGLQAGMANQQAGLQAALANQQSGLQAALANQAAANQAGSSYAQQQLQAALANQGAGLESAGMNLQAALANQAAGLQGAGMRLGAGQQLASLGNLGFGQAQETLQNMQQQGLLQQMLQQQIIDAGRGQFSQYQQQPATALGYLAQALGVTQPPQSQTTSSDPGAFQWASLLLGSDIRLKKNIRKVGKTPGGHNLYEWEWKNQAKSVLGKVGFDVGVLAQEIMETRPDLVVEFPDGYYRVNYGGIA